MRYKRLTKLSLLSHAGLNKRWVAERIAEDPSILGLGDVVLRNTQRIRFGAGRLDLLLQEVDSNRRYEVAIQLGKTDACHVIRTIEYWDAERKRHPQCEHTAVIVAEEVATGFLSAIGLFSCAIPVMALEMSAFQLGDTISLAFTTVLDLAHASSQVRTRRFMG